MKVTEAEKTALILALCIRDLKKTLSATTSKLSLAQQSVTNGLLPNAVHTAGVAEQRQYKAVLLQDACRSIKRKIRSLQRRTKQPKKKKAKLQKKPWVKTKAMGESTSLYISSSTSTVTNYMWNSIDNAFNQSDAPVAVHAVAEPDHPISELDHPISESPSPTFIVMEDDENEY